LQPRVIELAHFLPYVVPHVLLGAMNKRTLQKQISNSNYTIWIAEFHRKKLGMEEKLVQFYHKMKLHDMAATWQWGGYS
jgi:hypothetical protein